MAAISAINPNVSIDNASAVAVQRRVSLTNYLNNLGGSFESQLLQHDDFDLLGHPFDEVRTVITR